MKRDSISSCWFLEIMNSVKVEYQLTILGSQAAEKTMYLIGWIEKSLPEILENKERVSALK